MKQSTFLILLVVGALAAVTHELVAQGQVGQNINIVSGSSDQFIGDMYRQRQNEGNLGISSVNPSHMMAAYNDYRTVDMIADPTSVVPPSLFQGAIAKLLNLFRTPWKREREREGEAEEADSAQAWIGLSFTDNGKDWYTGLLPGHPFDPLQTPPLWGYEAASDPVIATTPDSFFMAGIAFTPNGNSLGFISKFTDHNNSANGQNIQHIWTKPLLPQVQGFFVDKPSVAAGPNGHVYVAYVVFDQNDPTKLSSTIVFFQSSDYGEHWSNGSVISMPLTRNQSPWIVVDPNNESLVYVGWRLFASPKFPNLTNAVVGRKSTNGGQSFTPAVPYPVALLLKAFDAPQVPISLNALQIPRSNAYPTAAIDGSGGIHVAMQEYVYPYNYPIAALRGLPLAPGALPTTGVPRITVTSSYDGGTFWTLRKAIDFGPGTGTQFMPVLTTVGDPGGTCPGPGPSSLIMLMYYDARAGGVGMAPGPIPGANGGVTGGNKQFDVRIAQATACNRDAFGRPIFSASEQLSRYTLSALPPHGIALTPTPPSVPPTTAVNRAYSMFCGGACAFTGDYIHMTPRVPYVQTATGWKPTTATGVDKTKLPAPVVQGVWADMRDAVLPATGSLRTTVPPNASQIDRLPWDFYQPPGTGNPPCINPGARDQNVYTAEYAPGQLFAAAPDTFRPADIPRAYPLYVENRSGELRMFQLTIDQNAFASFNYKSFDTSLSPRPALDKSADIAIGPYSTVTGTVVVGPGQNNSVLITVQQLATTTVSPGRLTSNGVVLAGGAKTSVTLYPSGTAQAATETHKPVVAPTPVLSFPFAGRLPIIVPAGTPFTETPFTHTSGAQNPFSETPFTETPFSETVTIFEVTDVNFSVTLAGSDAAAFKALLAFQQNLNLTGSYLFQVIINRITSKPGLDGCNAVDRQQDIQLSNIVKPFKSPFTETPFTETPFSETPFSETPFTETPFTETPFTETPFTETTDPRDPTVSNSSFYVAPPGTSTPSYRAARPVDQVIYTLRAYQIRSSTPAAGDPPFVPLFENGRPRVGVIVKAQTPEVIVVNGVARFDPAGPPASGGGAAVPVRLAFVQQPASVGPGQPFSVQVAIQDGFANTVNSTQSVTIAIGNNPAGGTLSGTLTRPAVAGIATFPNLSIDNVGNGYTLVATSSGLAAATSAPFDVFPPLTITTLALPEATQNQPYSEGVFATGGTPPYAFDIKPVSSLPGQEPFDLPTGFTLQLQGGTWRIAGTATTVQVRSFRLRVTDAAGHIATQDLCIHVDPTTAGPLAVTPLAAPTTPAAIAQTLVGEGVSISNVVYTGVSGALGTFSGGFPTAGISSGIILSSGLATNVLGPNDSDSKSSTNGPIQTIGGPGDADLNLLVAPTLTHDAAVLEFDFVVSNTSATVVKFDYVFASEEYNEFANSNFNDVFAFFLSGPNLPKANFALIPGTESTPVSINTVNGGNPFGFGAQHPELFVNNEISTAGAPLFIQADGLTKVLSLQANIVPTLTYHLKIAIADAQDSIYDSWVLLKAGSLSAVCPIVPNCPTCGQH